MHKRFLWQTTSLCQIPREPISGLILTAITNSPIFFLGPAAISATATALSALAITAAVAGVQYLLTPKPPRPEDGKSPLAQPIPPRIFGIGRNRVAGFYMLWEEKGGTLYAVQAICGHPINQIVGYYLHDDVVTLGLAGAVNAGSDGRYGSGLINIEHRLGAVPETPYASHVAALSSDGVWTASHRGDGQASLAMRCRSTKADQFQERYPYGIPQLSVIAEMAKMWDFRDPAQSPTNPATWTFSRNPAVALVWQECFNPFGPRQDYTRAVMPVLARWIEEANICDEAIPLNAGGSQPRYRVDGWATTDTDPVAIQNSILAACDGHLVRRGDGALILTVGKFREHLVVSVTDADIVGHTLQNDYPEEESINRLVPKFTYPATDYTTTDTDYFEDVAAQLVDGRVLARDANFEWVHDWRQTRRLGIREWRRRQEKVHGTLNLRLSGIRAAYARWVRMETPRRLPSLNGRIIENRRSILALMQGGFQMDFIRHPGNIDAWNPATDEGQEPPIPTRPDGGGLPTPVLASVTPIALNGTPALRVLIEDPGRADLTPVLEWRTADTGSGPGAWQTQSYPDASSSAGLITLETGSLPNDAPMEVRAAFAGINGSRGPFTDPVSATAVSDPTPPGVVTSAAASSVTAGQVTVSWVAPNSGNYRSARIYRSNGDDFSTAVLVRDEFGPPSSADSWVNTGLVDDTYYYWIRAANGSGIEAAPVATNPVVVT